VLENRQQMMHGMVEPVRLSRQGIELLQGIVAAPMRDGVRTFVTRRGGIAIA
jgi:hypothetical protein